MNVLNVRAQICDVNGMEIVIAAYEYTVTSATMCRGVYSSF